MRSHYCASPGCSELVPLAETFCGAHKPDERSVWGRSREASREASKENAPVVRRIGKTAEQKERQKEAAKTQRKETEKKLRAAFLEYRLKVWREQRSAAIATEFDMDLALPKDKIAVEKQVAEEEPATRRALTAEIAEMKPEAMRIPKPPKPKPEKNKNKKKSQKKEEGDKGDKGGKGGKNGGKRGGKKGGKK